MCTLKTTALWTKHTGVVAQFDQSQLSDTQQDSDDWTEASPLRHMENEYWLFNQEQCVLNPN